MLARFALSALIMVPGAGCCLKTLELAPQYSIPTQTFTSPTKLDFKDCCPGKEQKALALRVQTAAADAYEDVLSGKLSKDDYSQRMTAAQEALQKVILVCGARGSGLDEAWDNVATAADALARR